MKSGDGTDEQHLSRRDLVVRRRTDRGRTGRGRGARRPGQSRAAPTCGLDPDRRQGHVGRQPGPDGARAFRRPARIVALGQRVHVRLAPRVGDPKVNIRPALAESYVVKDLRTIDWTLKKGVKFHNGNELTAADAQSRSHSR